MLVFFCLCSVLKKESNGKGSGNGSFPQRKIIETVGFYKPKAREPPVGSTKVNSAKAVFLIVKNNSFC